MLTEHMLKEIEEYANKPEIKSLPLRRRKSSIYAYAKKQGYLADNESTVQIITWTLGQYLNCLHNSNKTATGD